MKLFFLITIFIFFAIVAVIVYLKYYYRFLLYKDLVYVCKSLRNNITFNKNTISSLLQSISPNISKFTSSIFELENENKKSFFVRNEDIVIVKGFLDSLGKGDVSYEINNITYYENDFVEKKSQAKENLEKDGKMYLKLIIGIGIAVCIILI